MSKEIVTAQGLFSKLAITLNDETIQKLAFIPKKDNPLATIEIEMKELLNKFEVAYFDYTHTRVTEPKDGVEE